MVSQPYVDLITDTVTSERVAVTAGDHRGVGAEPASGQTTERLNASSLGEVESMDVCLGEVTIRLPGS